MKNYELTYLISPDLSNEEAKELQDRIILLIQDQEGILNESKVPVKKRIAYEIKKKSVAFLSCLIFQLKPVRLIDFEKKLKTEINILRYSILIKHPIKIDRKPLRRAKKSTKSSAMPKADIKEIDKKLEEILQD